LLSRQFVMTGVRWSESTLRNSHGVVLARRCRHGMRMIGRGATASMSFGRTAEIFVGFRAGISSPLRPKVIVVIQRHDVSLATLFMS
jgi:hypothetical protein